MAVPHFADGWHRFRSQRPTSASSTSSPPPAAARVAASIRTRSLGWFGARLGSIVPVRLHIRLNLGRGTRFYLWFGSFMFGGVWFV